MDTQEASELRSLRTSLQLYKGLVEVSGLITSITDYHELLRAVLDVARRVIRAEAASLFLVNSKTGDLELSLATAGESRFVEPKISVPSGRGIAGWVFASGEPLLIPDAYADERFYKDADRKTGFVTRSILCAPLKNDGVVGGVLQVLNPREKAQFEPEDLDAFCAYADLTAAALAKLRNLEQARARERTDRDIAIAAEIQRELLSQAVPEEVPCFRFAAHNTPAANVGGDFYCVAPRGDGEVFFAIADVSGKGISASLLMAQTLSALEFVFRTAETPADVLATLNASLQERIIRGMFVTMLVGRLIRPTGEAELASAGHCHPLRLDRDGTASRIELPGALPLGILPDVQYENRRVPVLPGDLLVAFTDGLSESRKEDGEMMFDDVLPAAASGPARGPDEVVQRLVSAEAVHRGRGVQLDDLTVLVGGFA